jgi:uncharacterized protein (DUF2062 family)
MPDFRRFLPSPEALRANRWLRWLGPAMQDPRLWRLTRRGLAMGMALGFFFGLLVPLAQIPLSAGAAVLLRANVPSAVAATLVTNPVTFGPLYYAAWKLGSAVLREPAEGAGPTLAAPAPQAGPTAVAQPAGGPWWRAAWQRLQGVGKPLLLGLALMATGLGLATYFLVSWGWALRVWWTRRRRLHLAARGRAG